MSRQRRHTASTITDRALDGLYDNASRGWRRGDAWKTQATTAQASLDDVLRIVAKWYVAVNNGHGLDAGDLVWDLERAGHPLPEGDE